MNRTLIVSPAVMREFQHAVDPGMRIPFNRQIGGCTLFTDEGETNLIVDRALPGFAWLTVDAPRTPYLVHMIV